MKNVLTMHLEGSLMSKEKHLFEEIIKLKAELIFSKN